MLKTSKFKNGDIVSAKLISGEEIVAKLGEETDTTYEFNRPVSLVEVVLAINILFSFAKILIGITNNKINIKNFIFIK